MIYLAVMWTTVFCAAFGVWFWYGELVAAHMLIILGLFLTSVTFSRANHAAALIPTTDRRRLVRNGKSS
jgi:hypothetical protein